MTDDPTPCVEARQLVSADVDGELDSEELQRLGAHLAGCVACSAYAEEVTALTRRVRLRSADLPDPGFVGRVLDRARPARLGRGGWLRPALAWCGVLIAAQSIRPLFLGELAETPSHVARHVGASALALAVGLIYAAWRPHRAFGMLPLVGALLVTTLVSGVLDMVSGSRAPMAESVHVIEVIGMALLWLVAGSPGWRRLTAAHA